MLSEALVLMPPSFYDQCLSWTKTKWQRYPSLPGWTSAELEVHQDGSQGLSVFSTIPDDLPSYRAITQPEDLQLRHIFPWTQSFCFCIRDNIDRPLGYSTSASVIKMCCTKRVLNLWNLREDSVVEHLISLSFLRKRRLVLRRQHL